MHTRRENKIAEEIAHRTGEFLAREVKSHSLITVTRATVSPDLKTALILVSVLPKTRQQETLVLLRRARSDLHDYLKDKTTLWRVPAVDFAIDVGEENRQRVDEALREKK